MLKYPPAQKCIARTSLTFTQKYKQRTIHYSQKTDFTLFIVWMYRYLGFCLCECKCQLSSAVSHLCVSLQILDHTSSLLSEILYDLCKWLTVQFCVKESRWGSCSREHIQIAVSLSAFATIRSTQFSYTTSFPKVLFAFCFVF